MSNLKSDFNEAPQPLPSSEALLDCPAPAKLNLFLHVLGRRVDGYHLLQTAFQLIDLCDYLDFYRRNDGCVQRIGAVTGVEAGDDLCVRAARLLQSFTGSHFGVDIALDKRLPIGGGLGGGSSDAATTLLALNHLWELHLSRAQLMALGLQLGADVPFFLFGTNAFAQGIGEQLHALTLAQRWFVVLCPAVFVGTATVFSAQDLTRDSEPVRIADFTAQADPFQFGRNDLEAVVKQQYREVEDALSWLSQQAGQARMTGSGACVFASFSDQAVAQQIADAAEQQAGKKWKAYCVRSLMQHPLANFAV